MRSIDDIISEILCEEDLEGFDFSECFERLRELDAKVRDLEVVNERFKKTSLDLADSIENKSNLDQNKWALKTAFLVNRVRDVTNETTTQSIIKIESNAVKPVLKKLEYAYLDGRRPEIKEKTIKDALAIATQIHEEGTANVQC